MPNYQLKAMAAAAERRESHPMEPAPRTLSAWELEELLAKAQVKDAIEAAHLVRCGRAQIAAGEACPGNLKSALRRLIGEGHRAFAGVRLAGADFRAADLADADFSRADFRAADLSEVFAGEAIFMQADFSGARLADARLTGADLTGADFRGADLCHAHLVRCRLAGADFRGADLYGAQILGCDLGKGATCADFRGAYDEALTIHP